MKGFAKVVAAAVVVCAAAGAESDGYDDIDVAEFETEDGAVDDSGGAGFGGFGGGAEDPLAGLGSLFNMMNGGGGAGEDDGGDFCKGKFPAPSKPLHATEALRANGCGPQGMQLQDNFGLEVCCNGHDICYGFCGTEHAYCEKTFKKCMKKHCNKNYGGKERSDCHNSAGTFHALTNMMGKGLHSSWQQKLCTCFDTKEEADAQHAEMLTEFYEYLKSKGADIDDPAEKAQQNLSKYAGKEGTLYFKLGKKYGVEYDFVQFDNVKREL